MNYCSIEEAWGNCNYASNQIKEYMTNTNDNQIKQPKQSIEPVQSIEQVQPKQSIEQPQPNQSINQPNQLNDCDLFILHLKNCKKCYNRIHNEYKPNTLEQIINDNKDTIVLILIGMFILLFFNLINNITKN